MTRMSVRYVVSWALAVLVTIPAGCAPTPTATPQPSASATAASAPTATPTATLAPATATATLTPMTPLRPSQIPTLAQPPTATPPAPTVQPLDRPTVAGHLPEASPTPLEPIQPRASSLVVTPDQPPVYLLVVDGRLYRSTDRGATWSEESSAGLPPGAAFLSVAIDYRHPETMYAATGYGIYRRQGQGEWSLVNTLKARALAVDLENSDVLWAGINRTGEMDAVIVKSEDAGRTWGKADWGIGYGGWVSQILVDPNNPNVLWAVANLPAPGLWRGGRDGHWERLDLAPFRQVCDSGQCCYPTGIACDPNARLLYVGCNSYHEGKSLLLVSPNAGAADSRTVRWEAITSIRPHTAQTMMGTQPLAVDARDPKSLLVTTWSWDPGAATSYRLLVSHDDGATWETLQLDGLPPRAPGQ